MEDKNHGGLEESQLLRLDKIPGGEGLAWQGIAH
jgi:hypothetical protein